MPKNAASLTFPCLLAVLALAITLAAGCAKNPAPKAVSFDTNVTDRDHGYALLYTLVGKNKDVGQIFAIKSATPATKAVIKDIAALCNEAKTRLEAFAKVDPTLGLAAHGLPKYEQQTREAIEATTTKRLLFVSGDTFEVRLLQTQAQSTDYLAHLALLLSENDNDPERAAYMKQLSEKAQTYYNQVMARLAVNKASDASAKDSDQAKDAD